MIESWILQNAILIMFDSFEELSKNKIATTIFLAIWRYSNFISYFSSSVAIILDLNHSNFEYIITKIINKTINIDEIAIKILFLKLTRSIAIHHAGNTKNSLLKHHHINDLENKEEDIKSINRDIRMFSDFILTKMQILHKIKIKAQISKGKIKLIMNPDQ